jgi:hypothetical protein
MSKKDISDIVKSHALDISFGLLVGAMVIGYWIYISEMHVPMWDGAVYLGNARDWLTGAPLDEIYRPPFISWLIAGIWYCTGENWIYAKPLAAVFTLGGGVILYLTLRKHKGELFALAVSVLTMVSPQVFFYGSQIYPEGLSLFFLVATLYFIQSQKPISWAFAGAAIGLTFASRYPIVLQAGAITVVEAYARKNWRILARSILGAIPVMAAVVVIMFLKTGTFQTALSKDTVFTLALSPYYVQNSIQTWGWVFLLVPLAFFMRDTYADRYNYVFIAWFVLSMIFWSANATNHNLRFTIQFTPAVYFLALSALEEFLKTKERIRVFLRKELVFLPRVRASRPN